MLGNWMGGQGDPLLGSGGSGGLSLGHGHRKECL